MDKQGIDLDAARTLIDEISGNLAGLPKDGDRHQALIAEVAQLKALLDQADAHPTQVAEGMKSFRDSVDSASSELKADGIRVGIFLSAIGRMLGLD